MVTKGGRSEFEWDEHNLAHLTRHNVSPTEVEQAMGSAPVFVDVRDERGEDRWYALGATENLRVLFLVYTYRGKRIRPVTAWDASKKLREIYFRTKSM